MKIKNFLFCLTAAVTICTGAAAQSVVREVSKSDDRIEFKPFWYLQFQDGVTCTTGKISDFIDLLSPEFTLGGGYQFSPVFGLRGNIAYGEGKTFISDAAYTGSAYSSQIWRAEADAMLNLSNLLFGYSHDREFNLYPFVGLQANVGTQNELSTTKWKREYAWDPVGFFPAIKAGVQGELRINDMFSAIAEANGQILSDKFNSVKEGSPDGQFNLLVGLKVKLGKSYAPSAGYIAAQAAAKEAAVAAEKAAAEKAAAEAAAAKEAAEKAAREKAEAERIAAEKAAAQAEADAVAAIRKKNIVEHSCNIFFALNSSSVSKNEMAKVEQLAEWIKENPDYQVRLCGYADRSTGTPNYNLGLSQRRVKTVEKKLIGLGVPAEQIIADYKGDTVQPFELPEQDRVVMCKVQ